MEVKNLFSRIEYLMNAIMESDDEEEIEKMFIEFDKLIDFKNKWLVQS